MREKSVVTVMASKAERHRELISAGAICTAYDNLYIAEFEDEHPAPTLDDFVEALMRLVSSWDPEVHHCDNLAEEELRIAAAEISRRMAGEIRQDGTALPAQSGKLVDAGQLQPGDLIDLSRYRTEYTSPAAKAAVAARTPFVVTRNLGRSAGEVIVSTEAGPLVVPHGALVPVITS